MFTRNTRSSHVPQTGLEGTNDSGSTKSLERQRLIDALAAASVVTNNASPRADGKQKCLDVSSLADFLDDYQDQRLSKNEIIEIIRVRQTCINIFIAPVPNRRQRPKAGGLQRCLYTAS